MNFQCGKRQLFDITNLAGFSITGQGEGVYAPRRCQLPLSLKATAQISLRRQWLVQGLSRSLRVVNLFKLGIPFWDPQYSDYSILGSILGPSFSKHNGDHKGIV